MLPVSLLPLTLLVATEVVFALNNQRYICLPSLALSSPPSLSLSLSHPRSLSPTLALSPTLSLSPTLTLSPPPSLSIPHPRSLPHSLSLPHPHSLSPTLAVSPPPSHPRSLSPTITLSPPPSLSLPDPLALSPTPCSAPAGLVWALVVSLWLPRAGLVAMVVWVCRGREEGARPSLAGKLHLAVAALLSLAEEVPSSVFTVAAFCPSATGAHAWPRPLTDGHAP